MILICTIPINVLAIQINKPDWKWGDNWYYEYNYEDDEPGYIHWIKLTDKIIIESLTNYTTYDVYNVSENYYYENGYANNITHEDGNKWYHEFSINRYIIKQNFSIFFERQYCSVGESSWNTMGVIDYSNDSYSLINYTIYKPYFIYPLTVGKSTRTDYSYNMTTEFFSSYPTEIHNGWINTTEKKSYDCTVNAGGKYLGYNYLVVHVNSNVSWISEGVGNFIRFYSDGYPLDLVKGYYNGTNLPQPLLWINLKSPNGGEMWTANTQHEITWNAGGGTGALTINLEYSTTGSNGPWVIIVSGEMNDGIYTWMVPDSTSKDCWIRVTVTDTGTPSQSEIDTNDYPFIILNSSDAPMITINSPMGNEKWTVGTQHDITWNTGGGTGPLKIHLQYSTTGPTGTMITIAENELNDGVFTWTVPDTPSDNCYILGIVTDSAFPPKTGQGRSLSAFTITTQSMPMVRLTCPNGGESWSINSMKNITYIASGGTGSLNVTLEYSISGFTGPWILIANNQKNTGIYNWIIPNTPSTNCFVRITVIDSYGNASDIGNSPFTISTYSFLHHIIIIPSIEQIIDINQIINFTAIAFNTNNNSINGMKFTWTVDGDIGVIDSNGTFKATKSGSGYVKVSCTYGNITRNVTTKIIVRTVDTYGYNNLVLIGSGIVAMAAVTGILFIILKRRKKAQS